MERSSWFWIDRVASRVVEVEEFKVKYLRYNFNIVVFFYVL